MEKTSTVLNAGAEIPNTHSIENRQLVGFLSSLPEILRRHGVNADDVLADAGLGAQSLNDPESTIPSAKLVQLLRVAAQSTQTPHLGLELGRELTATLLSDLGDLLRSAPTLRAALQDFALLQSRFPPGCVVYLIEEKDKAKAFFGCAAYQPDSPGNAFLSDCLAMAMLSLVRALAGTDRELILEVVLSRSKPADPNPYRQAFGVDFRIDAEQTAVVLSSAELDHPLPGADPSLRSILVARSRGAGQAADADTVLRLRRLLRIELLKGKVSANQISLQLGMSRRTLHRRLDAAGVRYQEILDQTRCAFAQQMLADTSLRIGEIATIVGYTDPSALTRRFIRWTGVPPNEWRATLKSSKI